MDNSLTFPVPVDRIIEVQNAAGDTLCLNPLGQKGWHVQVVRGGQRHRNGGMQILGKDVEDESQLLAAVDSFFSSDYDQFKESEVKKSGRWWPLISILMTLIFGCVGLTFLAFMISYFMKHLW